MPSTTCSYTQTEASGDRLIDISKLSDKQVHFYTGLECKEKFSMVYSSLGHGVNQLKYYYDCRTPSLSCENQFLLTLMKLRRHYPNEELAHMFDIDIRQVSNVFITWINFIYCQWRQINWWPTRDVCHYFTPTGFRNEFPKTRVIVDGTECAIHRPGKPMAQQASFSTYKNRNTVKILVGCTPGGLVSYVSPAYGGSASDRQVVERSNLTTLCDPHDQIMSDKGFNVEDIFLPHLVSINIPTFFRKKNRMTQAIVKRDRKVSSKRVHIERIIGLGKTYKILSQPMNYVETMLATRITSVVFWLCNFRTAIISKHA